MIDLKLIWNQQAAYNQKVNTRQRRTSVEWMQTYILGLVSEAGQLLDAMRWKHHRLESLSDFGPNVPEELTDLTKYIFSMWILLGFKPDEMLSKIYQKGLYLDKMFEQDFTRPLCSKVAIFDLDNVIADTNPFLDTYMRKELNLEGADNPNGSIHLDMGNGWKFDEYRAAKNKFEMEGGYRNVPPRLPVDYIFSDLRAEDWSIAVWTARPVNVFRRIRQDTFAWFADQKALPDVLRFGREERILYALKLRDLGHHVVMIEDDPILYGRAEKLNIPTLIPYQSYNPGGWKGTRQEFVKEIVRLEKECYGDN